MDNNLTEIFSDLISEFDRQYKQDGEVNVMYKNKYTFIKSDGPDANKLISEKFTLSITTRDYVEIIWSVKDGNRTFDSKPDTHKIDISLTLDGAVKDSRHYAFAEKS